MKAEPTYMGQKYKNLFQQIISDDNLWLAYRKATLGKRSSIGYLKFKQNDIANLSLIKEQLISGTYVPSDPRNFTVYEPKERVISALPFEDRIVQHAICNIIDPIFDKTFLPNSYACRQAKGTHAAVKKVQSLIRHPTNNWILKTDFSKYFASIDRAILYQEINKKISCNPTLELLQKFIPTAGKGLPIGNLTSQLAANIYGNIIDRWLNQKRITFVRYMDDIVIVGERKDDLMQLHVDMVKFITDTMTLKFSRWSILPKSAGINFCGYRIWEMHKLIRKSSIVRARRKIQRYTINNEITALNRFIYAWLGHLTIANTYNLKQSIMRRNNGLLLT